MEEVNPLIETAQAFGIFFVTFIGAFLLFSLIVCVQEFLKDLKKMILKKVKLNKA